MRCLDRVRPSQVIPPLGTPLGVACYGEASRALSSMQSC